MPKKYLDKEFMTLARRVDTPDKLQTLIWGEYAAGYTGIDAYTNASIAYEYAIATDNAALAKAAEKELFDVCPAWACEFIESVNEQKNGAGYRVYKPRKRA